MNKKDWLIFLLLTLLLLVVRLPSFELPLDPDSGANAFFARHMLRGETLYQVFHPAHHLPGIYYTFELAFRLFGDHPNSPKLLLLPWTLLCAFLLYVIGRMYFDEQTGILGAVFFILVCSQRWVTGLTVEMEHFANLPLVAGVFLVLFLLRKQAPAWQFIWVGVLNALSILYKVTFVAPLIVAGIAIALMAWIMRREASAWKIMFLRLMWVAIGFILPLAFVAVFFASLGLWERFILVFRYGLNYFSDTQQMGGFHLPRPFGFSLFWLSINNIVLLSFGLIAAYRLLRRSIPLRNMANLTEFSLVLWLIISLALTGMRGGGFAHYVLPVVPPLALLAAAEINIIHQRWQLSSVRAANLGRTIFIALVVMLFLWSNNQIYHDYVLYKVGRISHADFLKSITADGFASLKISDYVRAHTNPEDFVYIWSNWVETYYYADRIPPIDFLWPSYVAATGSPTRIFDPRTKYIILDKPDRLKRPQWLLEGLAAEYSLETTIEGREIYRRKT